MRTTTVPCSYCDAGAGERCRVVNAITTHNGRVMKRYLHKCREAPVITNQPICEACWIVKYVEHGKMIRRPSVSLYAQIDTCCFCGKDTILGMKVRADLNKVPYPTSPYLNKEDDERPIGREVQRPGLSRQAQADQQEHQSRAG